MKIFLCLAALIVAHPRIEAAPFSFRATCVRWLESLSGNAAVARQPATPMTLEAPVRLLLLNGYAIFRIPPGMSAWANEKEIFSYLNGELQTGLRDFDVFENSEVPEAQILHGEDLPQEIRWRNIEGEDTPSGSTLEAIVNGKVDKFTIQVTMPEIGSPSDLVMPRNGLWNGLAVTGSPFSFTAVLALTPTSLPTIQSVPATKLPLVRRIYNFTAVRKPTTLDYFQRPDSGSETDLKKIPVLVESALLPVPIRSSREISLLLTLTENSLTKLLAQTDDDLNEPEFMQELARLRAENASSLDTIESLILERRILRMYLEFVGVRSMPTVFIDRWFDGTYLVSGLRLMDLDQVKFGDGTFPRVPDLVVDQVRILDRVAPKP